MAHDENKAFLRRVPLFAGLNESQLETLAAGSARRSYPKGRTIVAEGETSQSMFILLAGRAKVQRSDSEGKEVILAVIGAGEFFGEMSLIDDAPRSASVITIEPCEFMSVSKEAFKAMLLGANEFEYDHVLSPVPPILQHGKLPTAQLNTRAAKDNWIAGAPIGFPLRQGLHRLQVPGFCVNSPIPI